MYSMKTHQTDKTLQLLLSGKHPFIKNYAGKHVFVIKKEIIPLHTGKRGIDDFKKLKTKYGEPPILVFVPQPGASYILLVR